MSGHINHDTAVKRLSIGAGPATTWSKYQRFEAVLTSKAGE
jgi:hypothetical protein